MVHRTSLEKLQHWTVILFSFLAMTFKKMGWQWGRDKGKSSPTPLFLIKEIADGAETLRETFLTFP